MRLKPFAAWVTVGAVAALIGCAEDETTGTPPGGGGGPGEGGGPGTSVQSPPASPKAIVRFKAGKRMQQELSRALSLPAAQMCQELGNLDCFGIHQVVLGSPDAFFAGIYEALPDTTATTPLSVDRVVISACNKRAEIDLTSQSALIWRQFELKDGKVADIQADYVTDAIKLLYQRALSRDATEAEIGHHRQLYTDLEAAGSNQLAEDWATLSCFSVFTTMEALFY